MKKHSHPGSCSLGRGTQPSGGELLGRGRVWGTHTLTFLSPLCLPPSPIRESLLGHFSWDPTRTPRSCLQLTVARGDSLWGGQGMRRPQSGFGRVKKTSRAQERCPGGWVDFPASGLLHIFFLILFNFLTLQYCIDFTIYQHESATSVHVFPIHNPPPSSLPVPSLWASVINNAMCTNMDGPRDYHTK